MTIRDMWDYPTRMNEAMWYLLLSFFMMIWMWLFIWNGDI